MSNDYSDITAFNKGFDSRIEPRGATRYIVLDMGTAMSAAVYRTGGTVKIINMMYGVFMIDTPYNCDSIEDVRAWLQGANPGLKKDYIDGLDGTTISFLYDIARDNKTNEKKIVDGAYTIDVESTRWGFV